MLKSVVERTQTEKVSPVQLRCPVGREGAGENNDGLGKRLPYKSLKQSFSITHVVSLPVKQMKAITEPT